MKASEIKVGGLYTAKVNDRVVTVRVDNIRRQGLAVRAETLYDVTNLETGRKTVFRSAAKFRGVAAALPAVKLPTPRVPVHVPSPGPMPRGLGNLPVPRDTAPHLIVEARAGTGKTTTLVAALQLLKGQTPMDAKGRPIEPSPQQRAVWDSILLSKPHARSIHFCAFNRSIAAELKSRVPPGVKATTMHGLGYRAVTGAFKLWGGDRGMNENRVEAIVCELLGRDLWDVRRQEPVLLRAVQELVGLCKMNLTGMPDRPGEEFGISRDDLDGLACHYEVELDGADRDRVYDLVPQALLRCLDVNKDGCIDFDDMIWLPVALGLPVERNDLLLVDEAQDLNRCQQALAKMAGDRLVLVGDPRQAIYGFAGADAESMSRMAAELGAICPKCKAHREHLGEPGSKFGLDYWGCTCGMGPIGERGCVTLPLTVTRRCGRAIVEEARKIVPDFEAHESNGEGRVVKYSYKTITGSARPWNSYAEDGDMVVCRVNAPLVSECFKFIRAGRKANIMGRDVGKNLVKTVESLRAAGVADFITKLGEWLDKEQAKEQAKKNPSEARMVGLQDRHDCLLCFTEGLAPTDPVERVTRKIQEVFADKKCPRCNRSYDVAAKVCGTDRCNAEPLVLPEGIRLSSIHKAKGLEADRVFLLEPEGATVPHPMAKSAWQIGQEWNLRYVAITRAIQELIYVS